MMLIGSNIIHNYNTNNNNNNNRNPSMFLLIFIYLYSSALHQLIEAIEINNGVVGLPQVNCEEDKVSLIFNTEEPFYGRIFVKGMSETESCMMGYGSNSGSSVVFDVAAGGCNMRRQRRVEPQRGVEQSMTVIISFHKTFITKVDRAYRCTCFFMEADKVVTSQFEVSMLPTTDLIDTARMPLCTYSVHRGSVDGEIVTYARVGEEAYHVWECDSDMFGMLVHSCFVDDGAGQNRFQLTDQNGCAIDPVILPDLEYNEEKNMAFVEAHVFKFADRVSTYFQCAVSLCMKADGACIGLTPPVCGNTARRTQRSIQQVRESDMDVSAERIVVLDIDDSPPSSLETDLGSGIFETSGGGEMIWNHNRIDYRNGKGGGQGGLGEICLSPNGFGILLAIFLLITTAALATICIQCFRIRATPYIKG